MIPYRKFSDIQWGEFRTSQPPNPSKAPKVGDEEANDARTLDGLGALGAPTADLQNKWWFWNGRSRKLRFLLLLRRTEAELSFRQIC